MNIRNSQSFCSSVVDNVYRDLQRKDEAFVIKDLNGIGVDIVTYASNQNWLKLGKEKDEV